MLKENSLKYIVNLFIVYIILSFLFTGPIAIFAYKTDFDLIKLWKEVYIIGILTPIALIVAFKNKYKEIIKYSIVALLIYMVYIIYGLYNSQFKAVLYQIKLDFPFIFIIFFLITMIKGIYDSDKKQEYIYGILNCLIILLLVNSFFAIVEGLFPKLYTEKIIGVQWGDFGTKTGITIRTAGGRLRSNGLLLNFTSLGDSLVLGFIILRNSKYLNYSKLKKNIFSIIFLVGLYFANYKTAYLGILIYIIFKLIELITKNENLEKIKNINIRELIIKNINKISAILIIFIFVVLGIILNTFMLYSPLEKIFGEKTLYNSVLLRVNIHNNILSNVTKNIGSIFLGEGLGKNGTYAFKDNIITNNSEVYPLDSTFAYLLSNYGLVLCIAFIVFLLYLLIREYNESKLNNTSLRYVLIYMIIVEFYLNNFISNIPISYIYIFYIILCLFENKEEKKINEENLK